MIKFPARISLNVPIKGTLFDYLCQENCKITKAGFTDIDFSSLKQQPHVTLLMGEVSSEADFLKLQDILVKVSEEQRAFQFKVSAPYLAKPGNHFCFIGISDVSKFSKLKHILADSVGTLMKLDFHGGPKNPPHITLGYFNLPQINLDKYRFEIYAENAEAKHLGISTVGNRGTCIDYYKICELT